MTEAYAKYRRSQIAELADWHPSFDMKRVSVSAADKEAGSPKLGDKIARNPANHDDRWLVAADYFAANFEPVTVSEKGEAEAEAFPEVPLPDKTVYGPNRTVVGHFYTYARVKQFRDACLAYLSRGQG